MIGSKYSRTCKKCGKEFDVKVLRSGRPSKRKTCSHKCHHSCRGYKAPNWTQPELQYLEQLSQSLPLIPLVKSYNSWAKKHNHPLRTVTAINHKLFREFGTTKAHLDWFSFTQIGELLGIKSSCVAHWIKVVHHPLQTYQRRKKSGGIHYVSRHHFREFARHHPEKLGGTQRYGLLVLLEDEKWVDEILSTYRTRNIGLHKAVKVRCIETNKVYPSLGAASRAFFVSRPTISRAIERGWAANNHHFEYVTW